MNYFKFDFSKLFRGEAHRAPPQTPPVVFSCALGLGFALNSHTLRGFDLDFALDSRVLRALDQG